MVDIKYANAYSEVLEILKYIPFEDYNKIPKEKINLFEKNSNKNYIFSYDPKMTLDEQNVSKITKTIIAILFRDCWATPEEREKIIAKENFDRAKEEEEKREKYNSDDLFKNRRKEKTFENINVEENQNTLPIEAKKKNFFEKLISFIKNLFKY